LASCGFHATAKPDRVLAPRCADQATPYFPVERDCSVGWSFAPTIGTNANLKSALRFLSIIRSTNIVESASAAAA